MAVSRRLNEAADAAAARGLARSAVLAADGIFAPQVEVWLPPADDGGGPAQGGLDAPCGSGWRPLRAGESATEASASGRFP